MVGREGTTIRHGQKELFVWWEENEENSVVETMLVIKLSAAINKLKMTIMIEWFICSCNNNDNNKTSRGNQSRQRTDVLITNPAAFLSESLRNALLWVLGSYPNPRRMAKAVLDFLFTYNECLSSSGFYLKSEEMSPPPPNSYHSCSSILLAWQTYSWTNPFNSICWLH